MADVGDRLKHEEDLQASLHDAWESWSSSATKPEELDEGSLVDLLRAYCQGTLESIWMAANGNMLEEFSTQAKEEAMMAAFMLFFMAWARDTAVRWKARALKKLAEERTPEPATTRAIGGGGGGGGGFSSARVGTISQVAVAQSTAQSQAPPNWSEVRRDVLTPSDFGMESVTVITRSSTNAEQVAARAIHAAGPTLIAIWRTETGACPRCAKLEGKRPNVWRREAPDGPGLHPRCVLGVTPVLVPGLVACVKALYDGPVVRIETGCGSRFTVTPNHMFLSRLGFIRAADLVKGMHVVRASLGEDRGFVGTGAGNPDDNRKPILAHQVFDACSVARGVVSTCVPISPEDLHGDAAFVDGDIDVVRADSMLVCDHHSTVGNPRSNGEFVLAYDSRFEFPSLSFLAKVLDSFRDSTNGSVSGRRESEALLLGQAAHAYFVSGGAVADFESNLLESKIDGLSVHSKRFTDAKNAFPGVVTTSDVVDVEFDTIHDCPVYDFETQSGLYAVGRGIVSSNCRCWLQWVRWEDT